MYDYLYESEEFYDDYEDEMYDDFEEAYLEGYISALNEMKTNPFPIIGGNDVGGDILSSIGFGNGPDRAAAVKNYLDKGNTIKGGLIGGEYGTQGGMLYRKNRFLGGADNYDYQSTAYALQALFLRLKPSDRKKLLGDLKKTVS